MIKNCLVCKNDFNVKPSHFDKRFCCSRKCQNINQKNKTGDLNSNWKGGAKKKICKNCKVEFISGNAYAKRLFCSHKCSSDYSIGRKVILHQNTLNYINQKKIDGQNNPNKKCFCGNKKDIYSKTCKLCWIQSLQKGKKFKKCHQCDNEFHIRYQSQKFCSKICFTKNAEKNYLSSNNPNWKGGLKFTNQIGRNSKKHNDWIKLVFERDNYECQKCGQIGHKLNAHHIYPWAKFKDKRFELENGITLCVKCHRQVHSEKDDALLKKIR